MIHQLYIELDLKTKWQQMQVESTDNICLYPSQGLSQALSWVVHLVTFRITG